MNWRRWFEESNPSEERILLMRESTRSIDECTRLIRESTLQIRESARLIRESRRFLESAPGP